MSWSIYLSGNRATVQKELTHAAIEIGHAINALNDVPNEDVNVNVSGYTTTSTDGAVGFNNSYSVQGVVTTQPAVVAEERAVGELRPRIVESEDFL